MQWGAYEAWSAYGAEVPVAVPSETADQVSAATVQHVCQQGKIGYTPKFSVQNYLLASPLISFPAECSLQVSNRVHSGTWLTVIVAAAGDAMLCAIPFRVAAV